MTQKCLSDVDHDVDEGPDLGGEGPETLKIGKLSSVGEIQQEVGQVRTSLVKVDCGDFEVDRSENLSKK